MLLTDSFLIDVVDMKAFSLFMLLIVQVQGDQILYVLLKGSLCPVQLYVHEEAHSGRPKLQIYSSEVYQVELVLA